MHKNDTLFNFIINRYNQLNKPIYNELHTIANSFSKCHWSPEFVKEKLGYFHSNELATCNTEELLYNFAYAWLADCKTKNQDGNADLEELASIFMQLGIEQEYAKDVADSIIPLEECYTYEQLLDIGIEYIISQ